MLSQYDGHYAEHICSLKECWKIANGYLDVLNVFQCQNGGKLNLEYAKSANTTKEIANEATKYMVVKFSPAWLPVIDTITVMATNKVTTAIVNQCFLIKSNAFSSLFIILFTWLLFWSLDHIYYTNTN